MRFTDRVDGDFVIIEVSGKIMGGDEVTAFHGRIHEYLVEGKKLFVINLAKLEWMNQVGLGMLISALTTAKNAGGNLALANISKVESILEITRLITVFRHGDSVEAAKKTIG